MRKRDPSFASNRLTKTNGPQIALLSNFRSPSGGPKTAAGNGCKDQTSIAVDAEPLSSSDESPKQSPPRVGLSPPPPPPPPPSRQTRQRKPVIRVPGRRGYGKGHQAQIPATEAQIDNDGPSHIDIMGDGESVEPNARRSSRHDGELSTSREKKSEGLRRDEDEEDELSWMSSQAPKRRRFQHSYTDNIHGYGRPNVYKNASKKFTPVVQSSGSSEETNGFRDPRKFNFDFKALDSASSAPAFRDPLKYARSQSPDSPDSSHDAPILSQCSDTPQFRMPPKPLDDQLGSSQSQDLESPQFKMPASLTCYDYAPIDFGKGNGSNSSTRMSEKDYKPSSVTNLRDTAKDVFSNVQSDFIHKILDDQAPTSSSTSLTAPSTLDDIATRSDNSSLSSPPASPIQDSSQVREIITIPDSSQDLGTTRCPLCKEVVDEDLLDEHRYSRRMGVQKQAKFCRTHKQRSATKEWEARNYPNIDWAGLDARLRSFHHILEDILEGRKTSFYKTKLEESIKSGRGRTMAQSIGSSGFHGLTPGYYGSRGARIMMENIMSAFSSQIRNLAATDKTISSRGVSGFVQSVLVPELAVLLIKADMHVQEEKAREILEDSIAIGDLLNEEEDEEIKTLAFEHGVDEQMNEI